MEFILEQNIYDYVAKNNPELFDNENLKISVGHIEYPSEGFICLGCGNRGYKKPFEATGYRTVNITVAPNGSLVFKTLKSEAEEALKTMAKEENWMSGALGLQNCYSNSSKEMLQCGSCDSHAVVPACIGIEMCESNGCAGCHICNDYWPPERILEECATCSVPSTYREQWGDMDTNPDTTLNRWCDEANCGTLFARDLVYGIDLDDILNEMIKREIV